MLHQITKLINRLFSSNTWGGKVTPQPAPRIAPAPAGYVMIVDRFGLPRLAEVA